ncbi:hypothetical protein [Streptomyces broussonetiae]|uniref:hypothetical protein n=1 Tax=Streptomyces broussonetiae TaxID=2686304 RepID=UPI0035DD8C06
MVPLDMPGRVADSLRTAELNPGERAALQLGVTVRRSQGDTLRASDRTPQSPPRCTGT